MPDRRLDVLAISNAIVDVIADADDDFLAREGMPKGAMRLIDEAEATALYEAMGPGIEASGETANRSGVGSALKAEVRSTVARCAPPAPSKTSATLASRSPTQT